MTLVGIAVGVAAAGWGQRWVAGWEHGRVPSWASPVVRAVASSSPVVLAVASSACSQGSVVVS